MRAVRFLTVVAAWAAVAAFVPPAALGQEAVRLTTPYPAVAVAAGNSTTFDLVVTAEGRQRVDLAVTQKPSGWGTTLRGGGFTITSVFTNPGEPPDVQLEVDVPAEAQPGDHRVVVRATTAAGAVSTLALDLRVSEAVEGSVSLEAEFPFLEGAPDTTFPFSLTLFNDTAQEITFNLEAAGPQGWQVDARPVGQEQASTATVGGGSSSSVSVDVDPPDQAPAGTYPVLVRATGAGQTAEAELTVEITGNFVMTFTTPDERLNADVVAGQTTQLPLVIFNDGTAPLLGVELSSSPPEGWEVTFQPEFVDQVPPGGNARVVAVISPSSDAVAGDYTLTLTASVPEVTSDVEIRTTVKTSGLWGFVGVLLIAAAVGGLAWVFRRYGRR